VFLCATYRDDQTHQRFVIGMNISLGILAFLSSLLGETFVSFYSYCVLLELSNDMQTGYFFGNTLKWGRQKRFILQFTAAYISL
jgi:hypothetical protein